MTVERIASPIAKPELLAEPNAWHARSFAEAMAQRWNTSSAAEHAVPGATNNTDVGQTTYADSEQMHVKQLEDDWEALSAHLVQEHGLTTENKMDLGYMSSVHNDYHGLPTIAFSGATESEFFRPRSRGAEITEAEAKSAANRQASEKMMLHAEDEDVPSHISRFKDIATKPGVRASLVQHLADEHDVQGAVPRATGDYPSADKTNNQLHVSAHNQLKR